MSKKFPKGWMNYDPIKEVLTDARIVPFKCPLPEHFFNDENIQFRWSPRDVMQHVPNLSLVIDLTFKNPCYYDPFEFQSFGVEYRKIACAGQNVPSDSVYQEFCDTVDLFMTHNFDNNKIVGVHCTHGVNRTGYIICRFMVDKLGYLPEDALNVFALRRGYRVERENYIEEVCQLFPYSNY